MKTSLYAVLSALMLVGLSGAAMAGDAAAGKAKSAVCAACHGVEGISPIPTSPSLAAQPEQYLVKTMKDYKNGTRTDAMMGPALMGALSDTDIENLAAYYASLGCK